MSSCQVLPHGRNRGLVAQVEPGSGARRVSLAIRGARRARAGSMGVDLLGEIPEVDSSRLRGGASPRGAHEIDSPQPDGSGTRRSSLGKMYGDRLRARSARRASAAVRAAARSDGGAAATAGLLASPTDFNQCASVLGARGSISEAGARPGPPPPPVAEGGGKECARADQPKSAKGLVGTPTKATETSRGGGSQDHLGGDQQARAGSPRTSRGGAAPLPRSDHHRSAAEVAEAKRVANEAAGIYPGLMSIRVRGADP